MTTQRPQGSSGTPSKHDDSSRKHGLTESQSAYARPRRSEQATTDVDHGGEPEVPVRSNYQTRLGDVAAAADAARGAAPRQPPKEAKP